MEENGTPTKLFVSKQGVLIFVALVIGVRLKNLLENVRGWGENELV